MVNSTSSRGNARESAPQSEREKRLDSLRMMTRRLERQNERLAIGLRIGFRELENTKPRSQERPQ